MTDTEVQETETTERPEVREAAMSTEAVQGEGKYLPPISNDGYGVEGYGVKTPEYDQPYLDAAHLDPGERFRFGGDPEKAAEWLDQGNDARAVEIAKAKSDYESAVNRMRELGVDLPDKVDGRNYVATADELPFPGGFKQDQARVPVEDSGKVENENVPTFDQVNPDAPQPVVNPESADPEDKGKPERVEFQ